MNIAFITPSVSRSCGGIFEVERRLAQSLAILPETEVQIYGLEDQHTESDLPAWKPLRPRVFPVSGPHGFGYSAKLQKAFFDEPSDLAHSHGLWMFPSVVLNGWALAKKRPYIVTLHGMLDPWAVRNAAWKKRVALFFYERRCLDNAACLQVFSQSELQSARAFGVRNPIAVISNGIDLPADKITEALKSEIGSIPWMGMAEPGRKVLLYLGRIHPKKGLVNLLKAWAKVQKSKTGAQKSEWVLAIAGWDQVGHEAQLKKLTSDLELLSSVHFLGPQFNEAKAACYANCDAFILPSFSEGLPMVVLEAWAYGKPVLMTPECNLAEGFAVNAAIRVEPNAASVATGLEELFRLSSSDICSLGNNGRSLVAKKFTWPTVARKMRTVYEWVLGSGPKPDYVMIA